MAKLFTQCIVLLLVVSAGMLLHEVKGDVCAIGLGPCDKTCDEKCCDAKCRQARPGGGGKCIDSWCWCYSNCNPGHPPARP